MINNMQQTEQTLFLPEKYTNSMLFSGISETYNNNSGPRQLETKLELFFSFSGGQELWSCLQVPSLRSGVIKKAV